MSSGANQRLVATEIRAQGFQAKIGDEIRFALQCLNSELARLDKTVNDVTASHAEKLLVELANLNATVLPQVADAIKESTSGIANLSDAIHDFNAQNAAVLTDKLKQLVATIQGESKSAGCLTKWLIGTAIVACVVNIGVCVFTALMAFKTADLADLTKQSVEIARRQNFEAQQTGSVFSAPKLEYVGDHPALSKRLFFGFVPDKR